MKKLILMIFIIIVTTPSTTFFDKFYQEIRPFHHKCYPDQEEDYSKVHIPIAFMPGQEKCLSYTTKYYKDIEEYTTYYYRDLKEFIITKNNKYCSWGTKNWDEECQDASMDYAYGNYNQYKVGRDQKYKKFKNTLINFIKNIQINDIRKASTFTSKEAMFFTDDTDNCLIRKQGMFNRLYRAYFNYDENSKEHVKYGKMNMKIFRENLMQIDVDNMKFYLSDSSARCVYSVEIPYQYNGVNKYFSITFEMQSGSMFYKDTNNIAAPYDIPSIPKIYDLRIYDLKKQ